jgi:hypothetical protein
MSRQRVVTFPARCEPLPPGYDIIETAAGMFKWVNRELENEGSSLTNKWTARTAAFAHADRMKREAEALADHMTAMADAVSHG